MRCLGLCTAKTIVELPGITWESQRLTAEEGDDYKSQVSSKLKVNRSQTSMQSAAASCSFAPFLFVKV